MRVSGVVRGEVPGLSEVAGDSCFLASLALPSGDSTERLRSRAPTGEPKSFATSWLGWRLCGHASAGLGRTPCGPVASTPLTDVLETTSWLR